MTPQGTQPPGPLPLPRDHELVARLLSGDEMAFRKLVADLHPLLLRLASTIVRTTASAEEVVQDTWLGVLEGLPRFAGRSSLKTWIVQIMMNQARTRAGRDVRSLPFSALGKADDSGSEFASDGSWLQTPHSISELTPERLTSDGELRGVLQAAIERLPEQQRLVIELRDVAELESDEICASLGISDANLRVLLHRARHTLRASVAAHLS